jgi:hypothetical protein
VSQKNIEYLVQVLFHLGRTPFKGFTEHEEEFMECKGVLKGLPDKKGRLVEHVYAFLVTDIQGRIVADFFDFDVVGSFIKHDAPQVFGKE